MGNKVGVSMVTLMDLNDAIIAGTAPTNPTEGTLWIDSSLTPPVLKKWSMGAWVTQAMDLTELDPEFTEYISQGVDKATAKLGNLSSDDKITATERQVILDKLTDMLGSSPSGTVPLPAVATVNTYTAGEYYQTRKSATDAGVGTSDTAYTAYANAYTTLANYLNTILADGIYCWDVSNAKVETVHTIVGQTFRDNWKAFYQAQLVLQTRTSKRVTDAKAEAELYTKSYREQLVGNGFAGVASNRNFSGFTYSTAQKVTGPGSFLRTATGETRTDEFIAIEPDRTYRLMVSVINSTTTGTHNIGLECYNAAGTSLGKRHILRSGTNNALPSTTSFVHYEGVIAGLNIGAGAVTDTDFPAGTTQVKVYFNTNIGTTTNTIYVADVSFALETIEANKDYNGISLSAAKGMVITSTKNIAEFNATDGIKVYKKTDPANPVFKLDSTTGDLTVTGNINMTSGTISWANVGAPSPAQVGAATPNDVSSAVNNIKVGGRNLLRDSGKAVSTNQYLVTSYDLTKPIGQSVEVTISIKGILGTGKDFFGIYNSGGTVRPATITPSDLGADGVYRKTFLWNIAGSANTFINIYQVPSTVTATSTIEWIKLEEGNKATDWTPAPEDTTAAISNIKIGGTNLIPNSSGEFLTQAKLPLGWNTFNASKDLQSISGRINGKAVRVLMNGSNGGGQGIATPSTATGAIVGGETYTISFWIRTSSAMTITHLLKFKNASGVSSNPVPSKNVTTVANTWTYYEETFVAPADAVELYTTPRIAGAVIADMTFDIDELKVEKGNKSTDWSPAPDDINTSLSNLEIGGTNLLLDSEREQTSTTLVYYNFNGNRLAGREGKQMIISFDAKADSDNVHVIDVYLRDMVNAAVIPGSQSSSFTLDGIYRRFSYAFVVPANIATFPDVGIALRGNTAVSGGASNAGSYFIRKVQIEIGQNATDWSPAPEDTISKINAIQVGGTNLLWNSQFKDTYVSGNTTSKNPDLYAKLWNGYNAGVPNPTTSFHAHVDATTFGYNVYEYNESDGTRQWKGISITLGTITSGEHVFSGDFNATGLGTFVFGGFHYRKKGSTTYGFHSGQFNITIDSVNGWKRFSQSIVLNDDVDLSQPVNFYIYGYGFSTNSILYMKNVQLEKGNKMTEWSPAPEDSSLKISDLYTLTSSVGGVTVIDANKIQTGTLDATKVNVTKLNASNIISGTINASVVGVTNLSANSITGGTINASNVTITNLNASNITTGALNASLITTGSMNAARITAGTITGDRLVGGTITGDKISAGTIVASKLAVGATNLVNDPVLEAVGTSPFDATTSMVNNGWTKGSPTATFVDDNTYGRMMKLTVAGNNNGMTMTNKFAIDPTKAYKVTLRFRYVKSDNTSASTGTFMFGFYGYDSVAPTTEIASTSLYEYTQDSFVAGATNPYFYVGPKGGLPTTWQTIETYLYPSEYANDRTKLKSMTYPVLGQSKRAWFMSPKMRLVQLRLLNYNQSTTFGDGSSTNDLYIAGIQLTEVDAGTLTATNITAGTLNADLISIASATSGVTINSSGVTATNPSTNVSVKMNSTTGFEIKKDATSVFTVNTDGSLTARNLNVVGNYSTTDPNAPSGYTEFTPGGLMVSSLNAGATPDNYTYNYKSNFYRMGTIVSKEVGGVGTEECSFHLNGMSHESVQGTIYTSNSMILTNTGINIYSSEKINLSGTGSVSLSASTVSLNGTVNEMVTKSGSNIAGAVRTGGLKNVQLEVAYGDLSMSSAATVSGVNEVRFDLSPKDTSEALRVFSRSNGMGMYAVANGYTFLKHTPGISNSLTELFGNTATVYGNTYANLNAGNTAEMNANKINLTSDFMTTFTSKDIMNFDVKNKLNIAVRSAAPSSTLTSVLYADGTQDSNGVWVELGGGARTHVFAGEKMISPTSDLGFGVGTESLLLEANTAFYAYWGTNTGIVQSQGIVGTGGVFRPATDNELALGSSSYRWKQLFAGTTTISTSDSRSKKDMVQINETPVINPNFSYKTTKEADSISSKDVYETLKTMPLFTFKYKNLKEEDMGQSQFGFMADLITENDDKEVVKHFAYKSKDGKEMAGVSTQAYAAAIHIALQEEMKRNDALEKKVEDLEERLRRLEQLLGGQS